MSWSEIKSDNKSQTKALKTPRKWPQDLFARLAYLDQRKQEFPRQRDFRATSELVRGYMVFRRERLIVQELAWNPNRRIAPFGSHFNDSVAQIDILQIHLCSFTESDDLAFGSHLLDGICVLDAVHVHHFGKILFRVSCKHIVVDYM